ncbi:MAG TPA: hypothetical protein VFG33_39055, partial [Kribbella sp.]|nr:hypothetical protein [Kribbella sp.]
MADSIHPDRPQSQQRGPVVMRRNQVQQGTSEQRLLDSRGPTDWVHTDPWRVLRIQSEFIEGFELVVTDSAPGGRPGLARPAAAAFLQVVGGEPHPKFGWTDVARFTLLGVPAVNYGPGD